MAASAMLNKVNIVDYQLQHLRIKLINGYDAYIHVEHIVIGQMINNSTEKTPIKEAQSIY